MPVLDRFNATVVEGQLFGWIYIDQTKASLRNLIDLVEGGGELAAYNSRRSNSVYAEEVSFSGANSNAAQRVPLLS